MNTQTGTQPLPTSETNSKTMTFSFPIPYNSTIPQVTASAQGRSGNFVVQGIVPSPLTFRFTVTRTDQPGGWTENPQLEWRAEGRHVSPALGRKVIDKSSTNSANVTVDIIPKIDPAPKDIFAWVNGAFASQITYAVQMGSVNSSQFQCTVRRTDATSGWDENPTLQWTIIQ